MNKIENRLKVQRFGARDLFRSQITITAGGFELWIFCIQSSCLTHEAIRANRLGGFEVPKFANLRKESSWSMLRYFNYEPNFRLRWYRADDLFGSQIPMTEHMKTFKKLQLAKEMIKQLVTCWTIANYLKNYYKMI